MDERWRGAFMPTQDPNGLRAGIPHSAFGPLDAVRSFADAARSQLAPVAHGIQYPQRVLERMGVLSGGPSRQMEPTYQIPRGPDDPPWQPNSQQPSRNVEDRRPISPWSFW